MINNSLSAFRKTFQRLGERDVFTWEAAAGYTLISLVFVFTFDIPEFGLSPTSALLLSSFGLLVALGTLALLTRLFFPRSDSRPRPLLALFVYFAAGAIRGLSTFGLGYWVGWIPFEHIYFRPWMGGFTSLVTFTTFALMVRNIREHREKREMLLTELDELEQLRANFDGLIERQRNDLVEAVNAMLKPILEQVTLKLTDKNLKLKISEAIAALRDGVEKVVRPLSHQISKTNVVIPDLATGGRAQLLSKSYLPKKAGVGGMILPTAGAASAGLMSVGPTYMEHGSQIAIGGALMTFIYVFLFLQLAVALLRPLVLPTVLSVVIVVAVYVQVGLTFPPVGILLNIDAFDHLSGQFLLMTASIGLSAAVYSVLDLRQRAIENDLNSTARQMKRMISKLRQEIWLNHHRTAAALHGNVQSSFYAGAMRIAAENSIDEKTAREVINNINLAVDGLRDAGRGKSKGIRSVIEESKTLWSDFVDIDWSLGSHLEQLLDQEPNASECIAAVVTESISNAVKHGQARQVQIDIRGTDGDTSVEVIVKNNGVPIPPQVASGFGSRILDQVTESWNIASENDQTILTARVAVS